MKKWCISFIAAFLAFILLFGGLTIAADPFFHYHKPLSFLSYYMPDRDERYLNDGIVKHFDYDSIITGTSMTQNFRASEFDELFKAHCVKVPLSGASYREINELLIRAFAADKDIRIVLRGLDYGLISAAPDEMLMEKYPDYIYDDSILNDAEYVLNKEVFTLATFLDVIWYTARGGRTTTFDEYGNWNDHVTFGREAALSEYSREAKQAIVPYTPLDTGNLEQNVISLAAAHPETDFYLFFTPASILIFDEMNQKGTLENQLKWEKEAIELMLPYDNIHLYSFFDEFDMITDLDNYKDKNHYREEINSYILSCISSGEHELTQDNYEEYCDRMWDFYTSYDYDSIFSD